MVVRSHFINLTTRQALTITVLKAALLFPIMRAMVVQSTPYLQVSLRIALLLRIMLPALVVQFSSCLLLSNPTLLIAVSVCALLHRITLQMEVHSTWHLVQLLRLIFSRIMPQMEVVDISWIL